MTQNTDQQKTHDTFVVAQFSREDFLEIGFTQERIDQLTDAELEQIARKMGDLYSENGYWLDLELAATFVLAIKTFDTGASRASCTSWRCVQCCPPGPFQKAI